MEQRRLLSLQALPFGPHRGPGVGIGSDSLASSQSTRLRAPARPRPPLQLQPGKRASCAVWLTRKCYDASISGPIERFPRALSAVKTRVDIAAHREKRARY